MSGEAADRAAALARARYELELATQQASEALGLWLTANNDNMADRRAALERARRAESDARARLDALLRGT